MRCPFSPDFGAIRGVELAAAVLLNHDGRVLSLNPAAKRLLDLSDGLSLADDLLNLPISPAIEGVLRVPRPSGKADYLVWTTALINGDERTPYRLVTIFDPAKKDEVRKSLLAAAFRFTPAEMRLAEQMLTGCSPTEAAAKLGVTIHTVRTYLKRLYHKAGVRTQSGLVRAMMKAVESLPHEVQ